MAPAVERWLAWLSVAALAAMPLGQVAVAVGLVAAVVALSVAIIAMRCRCWPAVRVSVHTVLVGLVGLTGVPFGLWLAVAVVWTASLVWGPLRPDHGWLPAGRVSGAAWALAAVTVLGAGLALTAWLLSEPDLGATTEQIVDLARTVPPVLVVVFVLVFVTVNPVVEEVAYRHMAFQASAVAAPVAAAVVMQAVAFGTLHVAGFPAGPVGVALATVFGLALGVLRVLTGGLRVAVLVHVAVNATIAVLVLVVLV